MAGRLELWRCPPHVTLVDLATHFAARNLNRGTLWLTPTPMFAAEVRAALTRHAGAILGCPVLDPVTWANTLLRVVEPATRPLSDATQRLLVEHSLSELAEGSRLPWGENRGTLEAAEGFLTELKSAGVTREQTARWAGRRPIDRDTLAAAGRWWELYEKKRITLGRVGTEDAISRAIEHASQGRWGPFAAVRQVIVLGFSEFSTLERRLLQLLRDTVEVVRLSLPDWATGSPELYELPRQEAKRLLQPPVGNLFETPIVGETSDNAMSLPDERPLGLQHVVQEFQQPRPRVSSNAAGLHLIEAPGAWGEARLIARRIRQLLHEGTRPEAITVAVRPTSVPRDLLHELFHEYEVPFDSVEPEPLIHSPLVAFLLRSWRIDRDEFPFAPVAAMLRNTLFRPTRESMCDTPEWPLQAESLLRQLGEPRGREAYLRAVNVWAVSPPLPLEDESAEDSRRKRLIRLASLCQPFLQQFFQLWDAIPRQATLPEFVQRLKRFASDIGLSLAESPALARFWHELEHVALVDWPRISRKKKLSRVAFQRFVSALAQGVNQATEQPRCAGVRIRTPEEAAGTACDHLMLLGLGEGSYPRLSPPRSLIDDADRDRLRAAGVAVPRPSDRLSRELLLFARLLGTPRRSLTLSYAAVDERGQPLLPSSFLRAVQACFAADTIPTTRQRMPIEGYGTEPIAASEWRIRMVQEPSLVVPPGIIPPSVRENLEAASVASMARFQSQQFTEYDGILSEPTIVARIAASWGEHRVISPTALEDYIACPFKFWLRHLLRLEELEEPSEDVEQTRRGAAVHRAMARFHASIRDTTPQLIVAGIPPELSADVERELLAAVQEYAVQAATPVARTLWELEGQRLRKSLRRYVTQWAKFREPWRERGIMPVPHRLEAGFGVRRDREGTETPPLILQVNGLEIRIGGVIDRIDIADLGDSTGFWIIDYKTGHTMQYSGRAIERLEKLQLPLYAMAVQSVLPREKPARPLGMAYWLMGEQGAKTVLPNGSSRVLNWLTKPEEWPKFQTQLEAWVGQLVGAIRQGRFPLAPRSETCTDTCEYGPVCRITASRAVQKTGSLSLPVLG